MSSAGSRPAVQRRSQRTRDALLDALEALLREKEFGEIGVTEIARRANVSAATIYRRYDKKAGFIPALHELYWRRVAEWEQGHVELLAGALTTNSATLRELIRSRVSLAYRVMRDLRHLARPVYLYGRLEPELLHYRSEEQMAAATNRLAIELEAFKEEIGRSDLGKAAAFTLYVLQSGLADHALFKDASVLSGQTVDDDTFVAEITDLLVGYLRADEG